MGETTSRVAEVPHGLQNIFDFVARKLLEQNSKSQGVLVREDGLTVPSTCLYRGYEGKKCAAGHLIPDEAYSHSMEGRGVTSVGWFNNHFPDHEIRLLKALQAIHDEVEPILWHFQLRELARLDDLEDYAVTESNPP